MCILTSHIYNDMVCCSWMCRVQDLGEDDLWGAVALREQDAKAKEVKRPKKAEKKVKPSEVKKAGPSGLGRFGFYGYDDKL